MKRPPKTQEELRAYVVELEQHPVKPTPEQLKEANKIKKAWWHEKTNCKKCE